MSTDDTLQLIKRGLKHGLPPAEVRHLITKLIGLCSSPTWGELYSVLEPLTGLAKGALSSELRATYATLRGWKSGRIPQEGRFEENMKVLSELTGVAPEIMHEARSRSIAALEGSVVPRPGWAVEYSRAGLELCYYLQRLRAEADLTTAEVVEQLAVSQEEYEAWEVGQRTPRKWQLPRLWRVLGRVQGVLLCELQAARDRGAAAAYNERRRKAQVVLDNREVLVAIEYGWSLSDATEEIRELDETNDDHRWDYERGCFELWWLRKMLRDLREGRVNPQPITDITTARRFLEGQLRRPGQAIALGGPRPEVDEPTEEVPLLELARERFMRSMATRPMLHREPKERL